MEIRAANVTRSSGRSAAAVRAMEAADVDRMQRDFVRMGWSKPDGYFARCFEAQRTGREEVCVAEVGGAYAGHVRVVWGVGEPPAPQIRDLAVLPEYRRRGIGGALLEQAEIRGFDRSPVVRLGVGLHAGYGAAQRLYARRGYVPDGRGVTYRGTPVPEGSSVLLDDELLLLMEKESGG